MEEAETADMEGMPLRVVKAKHLAAIALSVGRPKDLARILALREADAVTDAEIAELAEVHGLSTQWTKFKERFDEA